MKIIRHSEIEFDNASYIDPNGKVFNMGGMIFRAVSLSKTDFFVKLTKEGFFQQLLMNKKIIPTKITDYFLDGYGIILSHQKIEHLNYCFEWPPEMLKDAALLILSICMEISDYDLTLQDAYPWNISFEEGKPIFIDIGSICEAEKDMIWHAYYQFCTFFLYPLYLYSAGFFEIVRPLLFNYINGISEEVCSKLLPCYYKLIHPNVFLRVTLMSFLDKFSKKMGWNEKFYNICKKISCRRNLNKIRINFLTNLYDEVKSLKFVILETSETNYYKEFTSFNVISQWNDKQKNVYKILKELRPKTVLDIGCNKGWYSILAAKNGSKVIAFDKDAMCISSLYNYVKKEGIMITPLIIDVLNPSPDLGWCLKQFPSAIKRFRTDMVFALGIMHHLVFQQWQNFERVAALLNNFAGKWLLIEFVPKEDKLTKTLLVGKHDNYPWYSYDNFIRELEKYYPQIKSFNSFPEGRKLLLCEK